jgi:putative ABC transport system permease protein
MSRSRRLAGHVVQTLMANSARSLLMMLGVAVGVGVLSAVIVLGQGTRDRVMGLVSKHGLDMLMVRAGGEVQVFAPKSDRGLAVLFESDARAIENDIPNVQLVSAVQNQRGITVVHEDRSVTTRGFGVEPDWMEIRRWGVADGAFITEEDMASSARVALLGARVARELFPDGGAVGRVVRVNNDPYTVKAVFIEMGTNAGGDDWDDRVVVPLTTATRRLFGRPSLEQIVIRVNDAQRLPETAERVRSLLRVRHQIAQDKPDDFFVREPEDVQGAALETSSTLSMLLIAVSVVALLAGGLVIMNLMLSGVTQRAREIGLRRAVGARASDISREFLLEALFVSLAGGITGAAIGVSIAKVLSAAGMASSRVTWVPFVIAVAACAAIGVGFGLYPARRAAQLDPATTLRGSRA